MLLFNVRLPVRFGELPAAVNEGTDGERDMPKLRGAAIGVRALAHTARRNKTRAVFGRRVR
jgi:hypothetical protein